MMWKLDHPEIMDKYIYSTNYNLINETTYIINLITIRLLNIFTFWLIKNVSIGYIWKIYAKETLKWITHNHISSDYI